MKGYPLRLSYRFLAPATPGTYSFRDRFLKKGNWEALTATPFRVIVREARDWTAEQQECIDLIYQGSPDFGPVSQQGPDRATSATVQVIASCVQRSHVYTSDYMNAWFGAYGLTDSDLPNAHRYLVTGALTSDEFADQVVTAAKVKYAGIGTMITRDRSTAMVIDAYVRLVQDALERSITDPVGDPLLGPWLTSELPVTLLDAQRALRNDPRWQYTRRANLEVQILALELICGFGGACNRAEIAALNQQLALLPPMVPRWPLF